MKSDIDSIYIERMLGRLVVQDGCWDWIGAIDGAGYPSMKIDARTSARVYRVVCGLFYGPLPPGLETRHLCQNRRCLRISHLSYGTRSQNQMDILASIRSKRVLHYGK